MKDMADITGAPSGNEGGRTAGRNDQHFATPKSRSNEVNELIELVARSLRPIYPLETNCGFDELLRRLDHIGL